MKNGIYKLFAVLVSSAAITACGHYKSLYEPIRIARLQSPELCDGNFSAAVALNLQKQIKVELVKDVSSNPPTPGNDTVKSNELYDWYSSWLDLGARVTENGDVFVSYFGTEGTFDIGVKYQLIGSARNPSLSGQSSVTLIGAYAAGSRTDDGAYGHTDWESNIATHAVDLAVVFGKRLSDASLVYGGPFYVDYRFDGKIERFPYSGASSSFGVQRQFREYGANIAYEIEFPDARDWFLTLEYALVQPQMENAGSMQTISNVSALIGRRF